MPCRRPIRALLRRLLALTLIPAMFFAGWTIAGLDAAEDGSPTGHASAQAAPADKSADNDKPPSSPGGRIDGYLAGGRWREGSKLVDVVGHFKTAGERVAFNSSDGKARFACLENLNSERVARIVAESPPDSLEWIVQGTLTEFRSENYLLLTQAVIRSRTVRGSRATGDRPLRGE